MRLSHVFCLLLFFSFEFQFGSPALPTKYPIKRIITLMMENRSFDHFLGRLNQVLPQVQGLNGTECNPENTQQPSTEVCVNDNAQDGGPNDPCHGFDCITEQIYGFNKSETQQAPPLMDGFVQNALEQGVDVNFVMSGFNTTTLPILTTLAQEFAVFDEWFCSCPCPTNPNREFMMSGTSAGMVVNNVPDIGFSQETYFRYIEKYGKSWKLYFSEDPWAALWWQDLRNPESIARIQEIDNFWNDIAAGTLPEYSLVQPRTATDNVGAANWQHPDTSVSQGEALIKKVYETLRNSSYWNDTLLIITYDEHGGFYDHYAPPQTGVPNPDGIVASNGFNFDRLGIRIPTIVVSPWVNAAVIHAPTGDQAPNATSQFESTSIISTSNKILGVPGAMTARSAWAGTFDDLVLERTTPRTDCPVTLPDINPLTQDQLQVEMNTPLNDHHLEQIDLMCKLTHRLPVCGYEQVKHLKQKEYGAVMRELWAEYKEQHGVH